MAIDDTQVARPARAVARPALRRDDARRAYALDELVELGHDDRVATS